MNEKEKRWFDALSTDRMESADTLEKPSMRGVQRSVVDKYSDQAHFIYELLQNADDVKATSAHFRLEKNGLYFIHNGSVRFTVSNPLAEDTDTDSGSLGHINSITSIANSSKTEASIGKFGVGFKAVFQYTQTPHIYDPEVQFRIERFIVPKILDADINWRKSSETVFFFPFDHIEKLLPESYDEILEKLKALEFPVLFLSSLKTVSFEAVEVTGKYTKEDKKELSQADVTAKWLTLALELNGVRTSHRLLVFTRNIASGRPCSIGYALGNSGQLSPISRPAFCFFPTKEATNLNFILHAPFLLTDSREGIKAGEKHNQELIQQLAQLAADSLPILRDEKLIDDGVLEIIPYDEARFSGLDDRSRISFKPFYTAIKDKFQTDKILPAANGECSQKSSSYWASDTDLLDLFSDEQLAQLTGTTNACWVFRSRGKKEVQSGDKALTDYIDGGDARAWMRKESNLIVSSLDPEAVLKKITSDFIEVQSHKWLHKLYAYLAERSSYQAFVKDKPIFLDHEGNAVSAFDVKGQRILFLPDDDMTGYTTVNKGLLSNKDSREFIEKFGVRKPSLRDEIYNNLLPAYENNAAIDTFADFAKFFRYFKECKHEEVAEFIDLIRDKNFLRFTSSDDLTVYRGVGRTLYLPTEDLKEWFETKPDTPFLSLDEYREKVEEKDQETLLDFFVKLGVRTTPKVLSREIPRAVLGGQRTSWDGRNHKFEEKYVDGCEQIIAEINSARSMLLWRVLSGVIHSHNMAGRHTWFYYSNRFASFESPEERRLRSAEWILNQSGELVSADAVTVQTLSGQYDTTGKGGEALIRFLKIHEELDETSHLSEEEARKIRLAEEIEDSGLSEIEIRAAIEDAKRKKKGSPQSEKDGSKGEETAPASPLILDIESRRPSVKDANSPSQPRNVSAQPTDDIEDADDYTPKAIDYGKKLDRAKDRYASELDRIERDQELHDKANELPRYSYGWFLALLELECNASSEKNADGKTISIRFGKVERDANSSRSIVLKEPSRFIPQSIEEFSGVRVDLDFGNGRTGKLRIESFTAKEFSLLGKVESADGLDDVDLDEVLEARIEVQNPSFLLQELLERFRELRLEGSFDMKANLTPNIEFVFGPPGTGKTTHLAEKVLIPMMQGKTQARVLVLAPTNKAADVLTARIMERLGTNTSYLKWLVRFGTSADERIEKAGVWRDRSFDIGTLSRSVTVTTIARFAYDGFAGKHGKKLYEMRWDAVVIDEASMIPLANVIYPLYHQKSQKFIIAGDPFQIEPIVSVEQWKDQNIYTLVGLDKPGSFGNPVTEPHAYPVTNLDTQYRSIPAIGDIFSSFTYDGILKHHRKALDQRRLELSGFDLKALNLIKFPVSKYESIYRAKQLEGGSHFQTYSALFTFEFVRWLAGQIASKDEEKFRIGVIAPYRAQANLLNRLNDSWTTKPDAVDIQVGTIHGFQGDECDIIIAVLNPPPTISRSPQMFLNKQNILNVAISRARDYLFFVMPDDETEGVTNLRKIAKIEKLAKAGDSFSEYLSPAIEEMIWDNTKYLEENTFSTGHQMVNVYRKPERYYEVRSDDSAIDVQIYEKQGS